MKPAISITLFPAILFGGCVGIPNHIAQDRYDKTQSRAEAGLPDPCAPGEQRTYRPTPATDRPTYDSVIPPSSDVSTRTPSLCKRRR
jgi:hypothetical protein